MEPILPPVIDGPFEGMLANSRVDAPPGFLAYIQNMLLVDGALVTRPGIEQIGAAIGGGNDVQGIHQWEMLDGTAYTCAFSNGDLYIYDWSGDSWTQYDLSVAGLTVSTTGDINCCTSRGRLIFTDGVNDPIMVVGPVGSIAYTTLTNAPVAHRCGVYYDKVFFWDIPGYENEFQWSDEGDPVNGYSANNQAWEFAQTDAGRILGMAPLNERMDIFKEDSSTMLLGSADENFSTLAVSEGLSETEGTPAGGSVVILEGDAYFLSVNGPRRVRGGQVFESLHEVQGTDYLRDVWDDINKSSLNTALGWVDKQERMVGWLIAQGATSTLDTALVFNKPSTAWSVFKFTGYDFTAVGSVEDTSGNEWVLFGDTAGKLYKYRVDATQYTDEGTVIEIKARKRISDKANMKRRLVEAVFNLVLTSSFEGEVRPYVDEVVLEGKRFGVYDDTNTVQERRYRRGFNAAGYEPGWEFYSNWTQPVTLDSVISRMTAIEASEDWDG
jgi:hypothetical protein